MNAEKTSTLKLLIVIMAAVFLMMAAGSLLAEITIGEFNGISERTTIQIIIAFFFSALSLVLLGYHNFRK